jgi:eukaryotic-like serine/threonine-protein kinase
VAASTPNLLANAGVASAAAGTAFLGARSPFVLPPLVAGTSVATDKAASDNDGGRGKAGTAVALTTKNGASKPSAKASVAAGGTAVTAATSGVLQIAVAPWGQVEVNGQAAGVTPPLTSLTLPVGTHQIVIRNADFPPYTATVVVDAQRGAVVKHRFGS